VTVVTQVPECAQILTGSGTTYNLTNPCLPAANGASVGIIAFPNNTYQELNYMCANCQCEPTCVQTRSYCRCTRLAGSDTFIVLGPSGTNCTSAVEEQINNPGAAGNSQKRRFSPSKR
jgi:hypothetical protein